MPVKVWTFPLVAAVEEVETVAEALGVAATAAAAAAVAVDAVAAEPDAETPRAELNASAAAWPVAAAI